MKASIDPPWSIAISSCGLIACLVLGAAARFQVAAVPIPDADTGGYLFPALDWLAGSGFVQHGGREWFYPAFIALVLKLSSSLGTVVRVQQLLGLSAVVVLFISFYLHWRGGRYRSALAFTFASLLMFLPLSFLSLGSNEVWIESSIRPEAVCAFFFSFLFLGLTLSSLALSDTISPRSLILGGFLVISASFCLLLLKPSWGLAFPISFLPYLALLFIRRFRLASASALFASLTLVILLQFCPQILGFKPDRESKDFLPLILVSIHAKQISTLTGSQDDKISNFLSDMSMAIRDSGSKKNWTILNFDGDLLFSESSFFEHERERLGLSPDQFRALCYTVYFQAWLYRPLLMTDKVGTQLIAFVRDGQRFVCQNIDSSKARELVLLGGSITTARGVFDNAQVKSIYEDWTGRLRRCRDFELPSVQLVRFLSHRIGQVSLELQLAVLLAWAWSVVIVCRWFWQAVRLDKPNWLSSTPALLRSCFVVSTLAAVVYGSAVSVAISHSFDFERYYISLGVPLSVLTVCSFYFILELASNRFSRDAHKTAGNVRRLSGSVRQRAR